MIWIYLAAAILGGVFVVPMILGGLDFDVDVDLDLDVETNFDAGDSGGDGAEDQIGSASSFVSSLLSTRSVVFFLAFFGLSGVVFTAIGSRTIVALATSAVLGLVAAGLNAEIFNYLKSTGASSQHLNKDLAGVSARVVLPISGEHKGRIRTDLGGQPTFMVASPYESGDMFDVGDSVVVMEVQNGTAFVAELNWALSNEQEEK
jgi:membrane protein implicated in regulation of membrane protease activity